jgi:flagellum-specific ATP synthase
MNATINRFQKYMDAVPEIRTLRISGKVKQVIGLIIESTGPVASIGEVCDLEQAGVVVGKAEVVGFREKSTLLMPLGGMEGIRPGFDVIATGGPLMVKVGNPLLGRVLDGLGNPIDNLGPLGCFEQVSTLSAAPNPLQRKRIHEPMETGIRPIDALLTVGKGQRMGIFSGSGVGKSVLLGMVARNCRADVTVIALIGERGREVREFIERDLGTEGLKNSVVVVATSEQPPLIRLKGALIAASIAEFFRAQGKDVMLLMDSVTRMAMAQREIGLAIGEPPATKGYTPSVFTLIPKVLERSGMSEKGSTTGIYTVLVEGDDMDEPIADAVRSVIDGHIVLSRKIANQNHYPAVDVLASISRCMTDVVTPEHKALANALISAMAVYREAEDLINIGAYVKGTSRDIDRSILVMEKARPFLRQGIFEKVDFASVLTQLKEVLK